MRRQRPPNVIRCNTDLNGDSNSAKLASEARGLSHGGGGGGGGNLVIARCATFDCTSANVDRKKVSLKRREIKEHLYDSANNGSKNLVAPPINYSQEILGSDTE